MKIKNKVVNISVILLICTAAIFVEGSANVIDDTESAAVLPGEDLTFSVLGDVHGDIDKFQEAIRSLYRIRPGMDALILNGDTVDEGLDNEYDAIKKVIKKNNSLLPKVIIKNIGNHEFFDYRKEYNTAEDVTSFINKYLQFAGEKTVYHDIWVKNYHFISLGSENGNTKDFNSVKAFISDKQLEWFKEKLAERHEKGRPIFVFLHQHLSTSMRGWVGTDQNDEIRKILSDYPEAIVFTSHTHAPLEVDNVKLNQPFTLAHTGAVHYTIVSDGKGGRKRVDENAGLYVEVHGNKTTIKGRNFKTKSRIFSQDITN